MLTVRRDGFDSGLGPVLTSSVLLEPATSEGDRDDRQSLLIRVTSARASSARHCLVYPRLTGVAMSYCSVPGQRV